MLACSKRLCGTSKKQAALIGGRAGRKSQAKIGNLMNQATKLRVDNLIPNINECPPDMGHYAASQRAAHQFLDNPKIFEDPLALRIIGAEAESKLRLSLAQFQQPVERDLRAYFVVRNRYTEDELARSIQRGVRQYVILGAGLDTFAYRNRFPLSARLRSRSSGHAGMETPSS